MKLRKPPITASRLRLLAQKSDVPYRTSLYAQSFTVARQFSTSSSRLCYISQRCRVGHATLYAAPLSTVTLIASRRSQIITRRCLSTSTASSIDQHNQAVETISTSVRQFYERREKFRIFHGSTNSTRSKPTKNLVDTSNLRHVLSVDKQKKTCLVEPNVSMDHLVEATLRHGLVPPVVMEFPGITVGGGYSGTSGESSSFKHGFFDQTINWVEMVLANGEVVKLSRTENADLFHAAAGALGTFGVTTLVELQLQEAKKFVETTYWPVGDMKEAIARLQSATSDSELDYVDGIMFSKTKGAIITGRLTNEISSNTTPIKTFSNPADEWFYLHVENVASKSQKPVTEAIPLAEYFFRYDRGGFWVGASAFSYFHWPFNPTTRRQLDDFLHTRMMYTALHASGQSKKYVVQDLALPYSTAEQFVDYTDETFGIYPLWLCPLKQSPLPTMHPHSNEVEADGSLKQMLNIGLWGPGPKRYQDFVAKNRDLEQKLKELGGMKWLYAHTYYDEDQFWEMFDRKWYNSLREKYDALSLPSVYEKVRIDVAAEERKNRSSSEVWKKIWPLAGIYGIWKAVQSKTYVEARKAAWRRYGKN